MSKSVQELAEEALAKVGCGRTTGHGDSCAKGWTCGPCGELEKLATATLTQVEKITDLENQLASMTAHRNRLQHIGIVILEDWWPLVYDRTCRQTVKAQGAQLRDAISND